MPVAIRERHRADRAHRLAGLLDQPLHRGRGAARAQLVVVAGEEEEQRVAAELEDVAAVAVGDRDQPLEDAADEQDQLLGAHSALRLEPLGERREARDVERDERARHDREARVGVLAPPVDDELRQVRLEDRGASCTVMKLS